MKFAKITPYFIASVVTFASPPVFAAEIVRAIRSEIPNTKNVSGTSMTEAIADDPAGGYLLGGWRWAENPASKKRILAVRVDNRGKKLWETSFIKDLGDNHDRATISVATVSDGYLLGTGYSGLPELIKMDAAGELVWGPKSMAAAGDTLSGGMVMSIAVVPEGLVVGGTESLPQSGGTNTSRWFVSLRNLDGDEIWRRDGKFHDRGCVNDIMQDDNGDVVVTGTLSDWRGKTVGDTFFVKKFSITTGEDIHGRSGQREFFASDFGLNPEGDPQYGMDTYSIEPTPEGGYVLGGITIHNGNTGRRSGRLMVTLDRNLNPLDAEETRDVGPHSYNETFGFGASPRYDGQGYVMFSAYRPGNERHSDVHLIFSDDELTPLYTLPMGGDGYENC